MSLLEQWYVDYCFCEFGTQAEASKTEYESAEGGNSTLGVLYAPYDDDDGDDHVVQVSLDLTRSEEIIERDGEEVYRNKANLEEVYAGADSWEIYVWATSIARKD